MTGTGESMRFLVIDCMRMVRGFCTQMAQWWASGWDNLTYPDVCLLRAFREYGYRRFTNTKASICFGALHRNWWRPNYALTEGIAFIGNNATFRAYVNRWWLRKSFLRQRIQICAVPNPIKSRGSGPYQNCRKMHYWSWMQLIFFRSG